MYYPVSRYIDWKEKEHMTSRSRQATFIRMYSASCPKVGNLIAGIFPSPGKAANLDIPGRVAILSSLKPL
jgi:hypothetical protein